MSRRLPRIDRAKVRTISARGRRSKVRRSDEAQPFTAGAGLADFLAGLPDILGAAELRAAIAATAQSARRGKLLLWGFGAHLIKVGLAPVLVDLMERGLVGGLLLNGAGCVHDLELAMMGRTSEEVAAALDEGSFGMARETAAELNAAIAEGQRDGLGMGAAVGRHLHRETRRFPFANRSPLATAHRLGIPATVHAAIGADIHHMHPSADGAALGATSHRDFETLARLVAALQGGVLYNIGSAVILPEVFLKALALARNLGHRVEKFTTVNLDFIRHYRPEVNVVQRPTRLGGRGISLIGHHEIMVPLIAAGVIEALAAPRAARKRPRS
ncbi:MAG: hypothetical protein OXU78_04325 [Deltaproteobacteria bacterium]|nr:hypothetical protein [Deltaproteobacteria bacterium]MDD9853164.1 hypothetical protein [Deltaproteobacteria bacterium]